MGLLALALFIVVAALLMVGATWGYNVALRRMVGDKHHILQGIFETGEVPATWRKPFESKIARLGQSPPNLVKIDQARRQATATYVKKLDKLIDYVSTSTLVDGEDTRELLLAKLEQARNDWQR